MYDINDTIIAVSSGETASVKKIIRISGDKTLDILKYFANSDFQKHRQIVRIPTEINGIKINCWFYLFPSPYSYTGEDLVEIHILACDDVIENIFTKLLSLGGRTAMAGEFTYRAFVNGKMDLSEAEAVAQMIESSNRYQLEASQKLFTGSIEQKVGKIRQDILELLSLIEAGLDFGEGDIEIISRQKAVESAEKIISGLNEVLSGSITFEQISQAPSVVIAGAPNSGKSSLVNALVGRTRSIVSDQSGTTRDVLEHWLKLEKCDCVLFDCAGFVIEQADVLQALANAAANKAVNDATVLIFCTDIAKKDYSADIEILRQLKNKPTVCVASKCDLLHGNEVDIKNAELQNLFGHTFLGTSAKQKIGLEQLKKLIEENVISQISGSQEAAGKITLTERHKQVVNEAVKNIHSASGEIKNGNEEIAAFILRAALQNLSKLEMEHIDEAILDTVFSRFCIGK